MSSFAEAVSVNPSIAIGAAAPTSIAPALDLYVEFILIFVFAKTYNAGHFTVGRMTTDRSSSILLIFELIIREYKFFMQGSEPLCFIWV
jgi:hypothetical protein